MGNREEHPSMHATRPNSTPRPTRSPIIQPLADSPRWSRRDFLRTSAGAALAVPTLVPSHVLGGAEATPPSERIRLGIIGCGSMGNVNLSNCAQFPDVVVTAACDADENRLIPVLERYGKTCKGFRDYRELLQHKELDAVIIATPPSLACLASHRGL